MFDPFFSGSQNDWQRPRRGQGGQALCDMVGTDVLEVLAGLAAQFSQPMADWWLLLLEQPGGRLHPGPTQQQVLATLIPQTLALTRRSWLLLLPSGRLALVLALAAGADRPTVAAAVLALLGAQAAVRWEDLSQGGGAGHPKAEAPRGLPGVLAEEQAKLAAQQEAAAARHSALLQQQVRLAPLSAAALARRAARRHALASPLVLVVEDDPSTALLLMTLLNRGAEPYEAHDARTAVRLYERHVPDLVLLDIGLPDVDGLTLLAQFRAADPAGRIVMLTANATGANLQAAKAAGAHGFLAKPFTRERVLGTLDLLPRKIPS